MGTAIQKALQLNFFNSRTHACCKVCLAVWLINVSKFHPTELNFATSIASKLLFLFVKADIISYFQTFHILWLVGQLMFFSVLLERVCVYGVFFLQICSILNFDKLGHYSHWSFCLSWRRIQYLIKKIPFALNLNISKEGFFTTKPSNQSHSCA